jgi:hypothetical protein
VNRQDIEAKAAPAMDTSLTALRTGNYVAVFTILILQEILIELTVNPLTNFNYIIAVSTAIANLNTSIKPIQ